VASAVAVGAVVALQEEASEDGAAAAASAAAAEVVVDSAAVATPAQAASRAAAAVAGEAAASAGEEEVVAVVGKAAGQSHGIISEFSICRWDIQNLPRLGRFSAFRKKERGLLCYLKICANDWAMFYHVTGFEVAANNTSKSISNTWHPEISS
jgi:hypothetical protein